MPMVLRLSRYMAVCLFTGPSQKCGDLPILKRRTMKQDDSECVLAETVLRAVSTGNSLFCAGIGEVFIKHSRKHSTVFAAAVAAGFVFLPHAYAAGADYTTDTVNVDADGVDKYLVTTNTITEQEIKERGYATSPTSSRRYRGSIWHLRQRTARWCAFAVRVLTRQRSISTAFRHSHSTVLYRMPHLISRPSRRTASRRLRSSKDRDRCSTARTRRAASSSLRRRTAGGPASSA